MTITTGVNPSVSGPPRNKRGKEKEKGLEGGKRKGEREGRNGDTPCFLPRLTALTITDTADVYFFLI